MIKWTIDNIGKFNNLEFEANNSVLANKKKGKEGMKKERRPSLVIHSLFHYFH